MKTTSFAAGMAVAATAVADMSICDKYTTALLKNNTAANQQTLLTLVVNTAVIGNYTKPNVGIAVPGILAPGTGKFEGVNLLPYFNGGLASTAPLNGGDHGVSVNFLDGGGAAPLMNNMPANNTMSAQYEFSNTTMQYAGDTSMYKVHKFMGLSNAEVGYFIEQVGLSAASFGVSNDDVTAVGGALEKAFGYRCSPPASIPATAEPALQAICIADDCPLSPNATCAAYAPVMEPSAAPTSPANSSGMMPTGGMTSGSGSGSGAAMPSATNSGSGMAPSSSVTPYTGGAAVIGSSLSVAAMGLFALLL